MLAGDLPEKCKYELILQRMLYNNCYWVLLDQVGIVEVTHVELVLV
jgi:hypothetical protein